MPIALTTIDQISNLAISITSMHFFKLYPNIHPSMIWYIRGLYLASQIALYFMLYLIHRRIKSADDRRQLKIGDEEEIHYCEYDAEELRKLTRSSIIQSVLVTVFHVKFGMPTPLLVQSAGVFKNLVLNPLFLAHIRGQAVLRPFEENVWGGRVKESPKKRKKEE